MSKNYEILFDIALKIYYFKKIKRPKVKKNKSVENNQKVYQQKNQNQKRTWKADHYPWNGVPGKSRTREKSRLFLQIWLCLHMYYQKVHVIFSKDLVERRTTLYGYPRLSSWKCGSKVLSEGLNIIFTQISNKCKLW